MHQQSLLCQPYDPFREQPAIYSKVFLPRKIYIALRPFHIARDLPLINQWLNFHFAGIQAPGRDSFQYTEDYYTTLLTTPNSQPLTGMIDHHPAFQVDIYQAHLGPDRLLESIPLSDNDYIIQLMLSPGSVQDLSLSTHALLSCLDCFFKYPEVNRVIWMTNAGESNYRVIAGIAGLDEMNCEDHHQQYYIISKQRFREVQFSLPLFPEEQQIAMGY
jgi:hypothetical protein